MNGLPSRPFGRGCLVAAVATATVLSLIAAPFVDGAIGLAWEVLVLAALIGVAILIRILRE